MSRLIAFLLLVSLASAAPLAHAEPPLTSSQVGGGTLAYKLDFCYPQTDSPQSLIDRVGGIDLAKNGTPTSGYALDRVIKTYGGDLTGDFYGLATAPASLRVDSSADWTVAAVVKVDAVDTNYGILGWGATDGSSWLTVYINTTNAKVEWKTSGGTVAASKAGIVADKWVLITAWFDADAEQLSISLNGGSPATTATGGLIDPAAMFRVGADLPGYVQRFKGRMSQVAKWSRVLSDMERAALYGDGTFPALDVSRKAPVAIMFPTSTSLAAPQAATNHAMLFNSPNQEHQFINSRLVDEPNDFLNGNVASLWHQSAVGGNSAMRFLMPGQTPGDERAAIGRGSVHPWDAAFIEVSNFAGSAPPDEFRIIQTGVVGSGGTGSYIRHRIKGDGDIAWYAKDGSTRLLTVDLPGNVVVGDAAIATTATDGFLYIPTTNGTPSGTPTSYTGRVAMVFDSSTGKLMIYSGGTWNAYSPD